MSMLRSETMGCYQLVIPRQSAWEVANALGQIESIHVIENPDHTHRPFQAQVKLCEESLQKVSDLEAHLLKEDIKSHLIRRPDQDYEQLIVRWSYRAKEKKRNAVSMMEQISEEILNQWNYSLDLDKRIETAQQKYITTCQTIAILKASEQVLGKNFYESLHKKTENWEGGNFKHKAGIITVADELRFHKLVFRTSRGNAYPLFVPLQRFYESDNPELQHKLVFFVLYPSQDANYLEGKLEKLVDTYAKHEVVLPAGNQQYVRQLFENESKVLEFKTLHQLMLTEKLAFLRKLSSTVEQENTSLTKIEYLKAFMIKEREIYHQLNQMLLFNNFIQGHIYIPDKDFDRVAKTISKLERKDSPTAQIIKEGSLKYPTLFQKNSFTSSAQQIVDTYGVPRYKEANPGLFTCVTFPFLFGVMFGDIMHGGILLAFGFMLVFGRQKHSKGFLSILVPHRYLITLMGFFSLYCGFVYNDYLSIALNLFGSCYQPQLAQQGDFIPRLPECVYPFGLDPVWSVSSNGLTYVNSMKMKISVIIGVIHMTFAVLLKASNAIYFRKWLDLFLEFIPQLLFMLLLFGYMDFLIFFKWTVDWSGNQENAPSIITTMINLPLGLGKTQDCCGAQPLWGTVGNTSQDTIQLVFLIVSLICIPWMLLPKPLIEIYGSKHNQNPQRGQSLMKSQDQMVNQMNRQHSEIFTNKSVQVEHHSGDEIFVHQMIETIEYVLGCISNTASYLRLWALSLAHSQLADVFFQKTVQGPMVNGFSGIPWMVINFVMLAMTTFGVLLCMDTMECFLHALRLHWVEFQNKFYKADGFAFKPYSFRQAILGSIPE